MRNLGDFARFLEAVSFSHASVLNVSNVARETEAKRKTVAGFLEVLEDLLLAYRLEVFTRRAKRKTAAHPKLYLFDAAIFRSLRPSGPLDRPEEIEGAAFFWAIEVKNSRVVRPADLRGLKSFGEDYPEAGVYSCTAGIDV